MLYSFFIENGWASTGLWVLLYTSDYALTIVGAKLQRAKAQQHFQFAGSYELNPYFVEDIDLLKWFSFRFFLLLFLYAGLLLILHASGLRGLFAFFWGFLVFVQLAIHMRHFNNIALFKLVEREGVVEGQIKYTRQLSLQLHSLSFFSFGLVLLFIYLITGSLPVIGGMAGCWLSALRNLRLSRSHSHPGPAASSMSATSR